MHFDWLGHGLGHLLLFLLIVILCAAVVVGWRATAVPRSRALDILKERYAKGEISREDFQRMRREIVE